MRHRRRPPEFGRLRGGPSKAFGTLAIEFLAGGDARAALTAMRVEIAPGDSHPPLFHAKTAEFFVVLKGGMESRIAGKPRAFRPGDYAYLPPGTVHEFHAGRRGVEVLSIFTPALAPVDPDIVRVDAR